MEVGIPMAEDNIEFLKFDDLGFVFGKLLDGPDNNDTIIDILKYMYNYHKAKSIIIENKYIDRQEFRTSQVEFDIY